MRSDYFDLFSSNKYFNLYNSFSDDLSSDKEVIDFAKVYAKSQLRENELAICSYDLGFTVPSEYDILRKFDYSTYGIKTSDIRSDTEFFYNLIKENSPKDYAYRSIYWYVHNYDVNRKLADIVIFLDNIVLDKNTNFIRCTEKIRMLIDYVLGHERSHNGHDRTINSDKFKEEFKKHIGSDWIKNEFKDMKIVDSYSNVTNVVNNFKIDSLVNNIVTNIEEVFADRAGIVNMIEKMKERGTLSAGIDTEEN